MTQQSEPSSTSQDLQLKTKEAYFRVIAKYEPLIRKVVGDVLSTREQRHQSLDDYVQDALVHTLNQANNGKMENIPDSRRLAGWISTTIRNWAISKDRSNTTATSGHSRVVGESAIHMEGGSNESSRIGLDLLTAEEEEAEAQSIMKELETIASQLGPQHEQLLKVWLSDPEISVKELGAVLDRSQPTVRGLKETLKKAAVRAGLMADRESQHD